MAGPSVETAATDDTLGLLGEAASVGGSTGRPAEDDGVPSACRKGFSVAAEPTAGLAGIWAYAAAARRRASAATPFSFDKY